MGHRCSVGGFTRDDVLSPCRPEDFTAVKNKFGIDEEEAIVNCRSELIGAQLKEDLAKLDAEHTRYASLSAALQQQQQLRSVEELEVADGCMYTGQTNDDYLPQGKGKQFWSDGTLYDGTWMKGVAHGRGKLARPDGYAYVGNFMEGKKHGEGNEFLMDLSRYRGGFADGWKHGHGVFEWSSGASYNGEFREDAMHGEGVFVWSDGRTYRGQWLKNHMHGQGRFEWPDGRSFEGRYECDKNTVLASCAGRTARNVSASGDSENCMVLARESPQTALLAGASGQVVSGSLGQIPYLTRRRTGEELRFKKMTPYATALLVAGAAVDTVVVCTAAPRPQ